MRHFGKKALIGKLEAQQQEVADLTAQIWGLSLQQVVSIQPTLCKLARLNCQIKHRYLSDVRNCIAISEGRDKLVHMYSPGTVK